MSPLNHDHGEIGNELRIFNGAVVNRKNPNPKPPDIELITFQPNSYTSLRDIIIAGGSASPSTAPASPIFKMSNDVSIRNPLVKQAALAYLQPLSSPLSGESRSWQERLKGCFAGDEDGIGCMGPLNGEVLAPVKEVFGRLMKVFSTVDRREEHRE